MAKSAPFFQPDYLFDSIYRIPPALFAKLGIRLLICDIDNTLVTYDDAEPTENVLAFLEGLRQQGISAAFLSNNSWDRVSRFNCALGFPAMADSGKPLAMRSVRKLMQGADGAIPWTKEETAILGDQIFTDVLTARLAGIPAILVRPIKDKTSSFFRMKRWLEKPFLRRFCRKWGDNSEEKLQKLWSLTPLPPKS